MLLFLFFIFVCSIAYWFYKRKQSKPTTDPRKSNVPDTYEFRVAVHEAGHAVAAWWCTAVAEIQEITIDSPTGGHVVCSYRDADCKENYWGRLVINLSGMAAEAYIYQRLRSGPAMKDLIDARKTVQKIIESDWEVPPWKVRGQTSLAFDKMFLIPLSEKELKVLRHAFQLAKELVERRIKNHTDFTIAILKNRTIKQDELIQLFGNRSFASLGGFFRATFL